MKVLNMYFSATGNTDIVAKQIENAVREAGHEVETVKVTKDVEVEILSYDIVFIGSGVYSWLPGKPLMDLLSSLRERYAKIGEIKPAAPRRPGKKVIVYCTFGGGHTGTNEAMPAVKYMGQLFDHLGYEIVAEWFIVGAFHGKLEYLSTTGRLGNIQGRPDEHDLQEVSEKVIGILRV
ncbi:MAG: flavodoxin family protein [Desulfomonilaceae bacterium]